MSDRRQDLSCWLDAEARGASDEADARLAALASAWLPRAQPPAGFAARVMAALPAAADSRLVRVPAGLLASWWGKGAVGTAVVVLGACLAALTPAQIWAAGGLGLTVLVAAARTAAAASSAVMGGAASAWAVLWSLGRAANATVATGTAPLIIVANLALASAAIAGLARLLALGKEEC